MIKQEVDFVESKMGQIKIIREVRNKIKKGQDRNLAPF